MIKLQDQNFGKSFMSLDEHGEPKCSMYTAKAIEDCHLMMLN